MCRKKKYIYIYIYTYKHEDKKYLEMLVEKYLFEIINENTKNRYYKNM